MKTVLSALALSGALLGTLACSHKEARPEAKALPKLSVSLVAASAAEAGGWVPATLQSTRTAVIATRMAAQVKQVPAQEGQRVAAGALLVALGDEDLQGQLKAAQTGLAVVQAHHRRIQALQAQKASTPSELEQAQAQLAQAQAGVASLQTAISYTRLRAPFAGVVQSRKVNEGDFVAPGMPLVELVGDGDQELVATLSEAEAKGLKVGAKLKFECEGATGDAVVSALSQGGDAMTHKGTLRAKVQKPKGLRQGSFARLLVPGLKAAPGLTVPKSALVQRGELSGVFIAKEGRAELRWLSLGEAAGDLLPVRSGLKAEDKVIDRPGVLQDGQPIEIGVTHGK